jgi:hypothetical protein
MQSFLFYLARSNNQVHYHRNLNLTHWASIEDATVKINKFKRTTKKKEKHKKEAPHQTAIQSWGL